MIAVVQACSEYRNVANSLYCLKPLCFSLFMYVSWVHINGRLTGLDTWVSKAAEKS